MQQKTMLMRYLIIGGSLILMLTLSNCGQTDYSVKSRWIYINETNNRILFSRDSSEMSKFNLDSGETKTFEEEREGGKNPKAKDFIPLLRPFIVYYGDLLCDTLFITSSREGEGPGGISNYTSKKLKDYYFEFTYRFNQADVDKADTCK